MKKLILFTLLPLFSFSQITWSWTDAETGLEKGTFITNGTLNEDGTVSSGTYTISDFTLDQTSTPISTSGSFANGDWVLSQPDIGFNWSGSYVTEFWRSSGGFTNGLNIYTQGYANGISMSIDYFAISQGEYNFLVNQSTSPQVAPVNSESDIKLNGTTSAESNQIKNVADPTDNQDAATKNYVDSNVNAFSGSYSDLTDTPLTITTQQASDIITNNAKTTFPGFGTTSGTALAGDTALFSGSYNDLTEKPTTYTQSEVDAIISDLQNQINDLKPLKDVDGNTYDFITYGDQTWSVENAKVVRYRDGTEIPQVTDATVWNNLNTGAWCYYNNDATKPRLYNWYAVMGIHDTDGNTPNKAFAPEGWHVPSNYEWNTLENYLIANGYNYDGTTTGDKIAKSMASTTGWNSANSAGKVGNDQSTNNSSGFNAFPEGYLFGNGFAGEGNMTYFWVSNQTNPNSAWTRYLSYGNSALTADPNPSKRVGLSVRFVRD